MNDFNRSNALEQVIVEKLKWSKEFTNNERDLHQEQTLNELRIIIEAGPRRFGSTTAISNLFDPSKDVLIASSRSMLMEYNERLLLLDKVKNKSKFDFTYLIHRFDTDDYIEEDVIRKISKLTISEYEEVTGKEFPLANSYVSKKIYNYEYSNNAPYFNSLRGKSLKEDAVVYIDAGGTYSIKYYHNILRLIKFIDISCGRSNNIRYVIF